MASPGPGVVMVMILLMMVLVMIHFIGARSLNTAIVHHQVS